MTAYYVDSALGSDANAGTSAGAGNAWLTVQKAADTAVAGDICYIKSGTDYTELVDFDTNAGTQSSPITFVGYTTTITDNGKATINGSNTRASCIKPTATADYVVFKNIIFTGPTTQCVLGPSSNSSVLGWRFCNCEFTKGSSTPSRSFYAAGYSPWATLRFDGCLFSGFTGDGCLSPVGTMVSFLNCKVIDNGGHGILLKGYGQGHSVIGCIIAGNTGDGINVPTNGGGIVILRNTIEGNGGDGIDIAATGAAGTMIVHGNLIANHSGAGDTGLKHGTQAANVNITCDRNFFYNNNTNTSGAMAAGANDVSLSADPFTNSASDNWTLNTTSGGGTAVRAAYGSSFDGTNIGYADGGALQHQDAGGSGGVKCDGGMVGGMRG